MAFAVSLDNRAADHRLRLIFPTGAASVETARADTAFDVITRPARIPVPDTIRNESPVSSMPMISMVDAGDAGTGATVIGKGLMEYEIVEEIKTYNADHAELAEKATIASASSSFIVVREPAIAITRWACAICHATILRRARQAMGPPVAPPAAQCLDRAFRAGVRTAWRRRSPAS